FSCILAAAIHAQPLNTYTSEDSKPRGSPLPNQDPPLQSSATDSRRPIESSLSPLFTRVQFNFTSVQSRTLSHPQVSSQDMSPMHKSQPQPSTLSSAITTRRTQTRREPRRPTKASHPVNHHKTPPDASPPCSLQRQPACYKAIEIQDKLSIPPNIYSL